MTDSRMGKIVNGEEMRAEVDAIVERVLMMLGDAESMRWSGMEHRDRESYASRVRRGAEDVAEMAESLRKSARRAGRA